MGTRQGFRRRFSSRQKTGLLLAAVAMVIGALLWLGLPDWQVHSDGRKAVEKFLKQEQKGDFGSAWELFHPAMHERFAKDAYIQKRAHVLMQDFGAKTFAYTLEGGSMLREWTMAAGKTPLRNVYKVSATLKMDTVFGKVGIQQTFYAVQEDGLWKVLWDYGGKEKN